MIYQLLIYAGGDMFSYDMALNKQVSRSDYEGLLPYVNQWTDTFKAKQCVCLHLLILKLDPLNGITEVVKNDFYKHPLKKRVEINKKAQEGSTNRNSQKISVQAILQEMNQLQQAAPEPAPLNWNTIGNNQF